MTENFDEADKICWEQPGNHSLVKENLNGINYYLIFIVKPVLMMKLCDDFDYALKLSKKMIDNGVRVFEDFESLFEWYNQKPMSNES